MKTMRPYVPPPFVMRRLVNPILVHLPIGTTLVVRGRRSGKLVETPLVPIEIGGARYLVSGGGDTHWARNLRTAGRAVLRTNGRPEEIRAIELDGAERDRVVRAYQQKYGAVVGGYFKRLADPADHAAFRVEPI